jgi:hypothetical protein
MINGHHRLYAQSTFATVLGRLATSLAALAILCCSSSAHAQFGFPRIGGVVGGVSIDADGTVRSSSAEDRSGWLKSMRDVATSPSGDLAENVPLRMVSLTKLQAEIDRAISENRPLSEDMLYLAGLQRVEFVFVYPEQNDIVIAGPAESWIVREDASVVGKTSGRPVLQLEDLIVALRTTEATQQAPITVSINPTPEGQLRLNNLLSQVRTGPGFNPAQIEPAMKEAFGPQQVTLTTVPLDSRMAQTLVAADYRMKRLAMGLEDIPVQGLKSYLEMIRNGGPKNGMQPRWWMACDYDAILHSDDMLAWKLTGTGIKAMTEDEIVHATGVRTGSGSANKQAQAWSDKFTAKFDELCGHNAAFGDLRNVMDLNIVATVIRAHELEKVAGCDFGLLRGEAGSLETPAWQSPKTISPECSFIRGTAGWTVTASGGVEINPWKEVSQKAKVDAGVKTVHSQSAADADNAKWWWN